MEPGGLEPPTFCMPCRRAPNCAMAPFLSQCRQATPLCGRRPLRAAASVPASAVVAKDSGPRSEAEPGTATKVIGVLFDTGGSRRAPHPGQVRYTIPVNHDIAEPRPAGVAIPEMKSEISPIRLTAAVAPNGAPMTYGRKDRIPTRSQQPGRVGASVRFNTVRFRSVARVLRGRARRGCSAGSIRIEGGRWALSACASRFRGRRRIIRRHVAASHGAAIHQVDGRTLGARQHARTFCRQLFCRRGERNFYRSFPGHRNKLTRSVWAPRSLPAGYAVSYRTRSGANSQAENLFIAAQIPSYIVVPLRSRWSMAGRLFHHRWAMGTMAPGLLAGSHTIPAMRQ